MGFLWGYQRTLHLFLLLAVILLYVAYWTTIYVFTNSITLVAWWYPLLAVLFLIAWIERGCASCNCCFPFYHYSTLLVELVLQVGSLAAHIYSLVIVTESTFNQTGANPTLDFIVYGLLALTIAVYFLIVYKCVLFKFTLYYINLYVISSLLVYSYIQVLV